MSVQEIVRLGHPVLRQLAAPFPVEEIQTAAFTQLVKDLRETLADSGGIGLAAPQIAVSTQVAVIEITNPKTRYGEIETLPFSVFVNPVISVLNPEVAGYWEGCLSVPGMMGFVERPQHIRIDYLDEQGDAQSMELQGFLATVFQHEFDHLCGHLYVDKLKDPALFCFEAEYSKYHTSPE
ncbi:MAG: peptide deformylase [Candidatus Azotimanducaceae bacterium]|jgi:peptide deformylase